MPITYKKIASVTVGSGGAADIEFTSIPGTYTDLVLKVSARCDFATLVTQMNISFNASTSNFTWRFLSGDGSAAGSSSGSNNRGGIDNGSTSTASTFSNTEIYIPNYAGSTNKSYSSDSVVENNATQGYGNLLAGLWSQTSAITSIKLTDASGNFVQHSTATLYGISKS